MLALERGQSDMSTEECVIEEELRPADFVEDGTKQVCHLIIFRMSYLGMTLTGYSPHEGQWGIPLFYADGKKMYSLRQFNVFDAARQCRWMCSVVQIKWNLPGIDPFSNFLFSALLRSS